jgi:uncharacterized protein (DUF4415 family)
MKIIQIISKHKKKRANPPRDSYRKPAPLKIGYERVEAVIQEGKTIQTKHIDILKDNN